MNTPKPKVWLVMEGWFSAINSLRFIVKHNLLEPVAVEVCDDKLASFIQQVIGNYPIDYEKPIGIHLTKREKELVSHCIFYHDERKDEKNRLSDSTFEYLMKSLQ